MDIEKSITEFLNFVLVETGEEENFGLLLNFLDKLPIIIFLVEYTFDEFGILKTHQKTMHYG